MPFEVRKVYQKPVDFVKSLKPRKCTLPKFIKDPINSSVVPASTKRGMLNHSHINSFSSLTREALEQATGFVSGLEYYLSKLL